MILVSLGGNESRLRQCICAIGYVFSECLKNNVNPFDFTDVVVDAHLSESTTDILQQSYDHIVLVVKIGKV